MDNELRKIEVANFRQIVSRALSCENLWKWIMECVNTYSHRLAEARRVFAWSHLARTSREPIPAAAS